MSQLGGDDQVMAAKERMVPMVFQIVGIFDVVLGIAIAAFGPGFVGGEPLVDTVLLIAGAVFVLTGLGLVWWGRRRAAALAAGGGAVERHPR